MHESCVSIIRHRLSPGKINPIGPLRSNLGQINRSNRTFRSITAGRSIYSDDSSGAKDHRKERRRRCLNRDRPTAPGLVINAIVHNLHLLWCLSFCFSAEPTNSWSNKGRWKRRIILSAAATTTAVVSFIAAAVIAVIQWSPFAHLLLLMNCFSLQNWLARLLTAFILSCYMPSCMSSTFSWWSPSPGHWQICYLPQHRLGRCVKSGGRPWVRFDAILYKLPVRTICSNHSNGSKHGLTERLERITPPFFFFLLTHVIMHTHKQTNKHIQIPLFSADVPLTRRYLDGIYKSIGLEPRWHQKCL